MRRTAVLMLTASAILLLPQSPAKAGGWWTTLDLHAQYLGIGESVSVKISEVWYDSIAEAEAARDVKHYAYLVKEFDRRLLDRAMTRPEPQHWWRPLSPVVKAGEVTVFDNDSNLSRGRVHLSVPEVAPGHYYLMLCNAGCRIPLGHHIPIRVTVTEDVLAAQTARHLEVTKERLHVALARVRHDVRATQRRLERVREEVTDAHDAVAARPASSETKTDEDKTPWLAYAGWFIAGASLMFAFARRVRRVRSEPDLVLEQIPDDARELTRTP